MELSRLQLELILRPSDNDQGSGPHPYAPAPYTPTPSAELIGSSLYRRQASRHIRHGHTFLTSKP